jgi:regulatory protein
LSRLSLTKDQALIKLQRYCAYQERCHQEVRNKLIALKVFGDDLEDVISNLISEGFLNEERYARAYVRGKARIKRWGKMKIVAQLKSRQISDYCIRKGLEELDEELNLENIDYWIEKGRNDYVGQEPYLLKSKISALLNRKGFSYEDFCKKI